MSIKETEAFPKIIELFKAVLYTNLTCFNISYLYTSQIADQTDTFVMDANTVNMLIESYFTML